MNVSPRTWLMALGGAIVVIVALTGSVLLAGTPDAAIPDDLAASPSITASSGETVGYTLPPGGSASTVGADLERIGVINAGLRFELLLRLMGLENSLAAGDYTLALGSSTLAVIDQLRVREGDEGTSVVFPEGIRIEEMAEIVEESGLGTAEEFMAAVANAELSPETAATLPEGHDLQGYLFPDTYEATSVEQLVSRMIQRFENQFDEALRDAAAGQGLNLHQALTLASIVEREAVIPEERPLIAGVFFNRIAAGDLIGADPTVQFAVALDPASVAEFGWWKSGLTSVDLENPSPYNTRLYPGIPPGPIANPGLASIEAVAYPEQTDYYYFVADTIAADGSHVFAVTLEEHLANVARMEAAAQ